MTRAAAVWVPPGLGISGDHCFSSHGRSPQLRGGGAIEALDYEYKGSARLHMPRLFDYQMRMRKVVHGFGERYVKRILPTCGGV